MKKIIDIYNRIEEIALIAVLATITLTCFVQVIMRYLFNAALPWVEEFCMLLMIWSSFVGMSIGQRMGEHIKITLLTDRLPFRVAHLLNLISDIIVIALCVATAFWGVKMAMMFRNSMYSSIPVSYSVAYMSIPTGCTLMALRLLGGSVRKSVTVLVKGEKAVEGGSETV